VSQCLVVKSPVKVNWMWDVTMPSALDLQEGSQYNLTSVSDLGSPTTSVVNVKLTDAALKAFEVFYKSQVLSMNVLKNI